MPPEAFNIRDGDDIPPLLTELESLSPAPAAIAAEGAGELLDVCKAYLNFQTCPRCQAGEMCDDCADAYAAIHERARAAVAASGGNAGE